jgi:ribonuclease HII
VPCSFEHERALQEQGFLRIAGIDEAGRGPLAGPVVAAAVVFQNSKIPQPGLNDSKKLSPRRRDELYQHLTQAAGVLWAVSIQDVKTIDRINILKATHQAMRTAALTLSRSPDHALIDGLPVPNFPIPHTALVQGDGRSQSIAAASIIAKVTRDRIMDDMDAIYPQYGFRQHKGYGTAAHLAALQTHGPCPIHRRSFAPVARALRS